MHKSVLIELYSRFIGSLINSNEPLFEEEEETVLYDFQFFHDCITRSESFYTDNVFSLLKSANPVKVKKAKEIIDVRTDNDFYL